jgi:hypothetical protein
MEDTSDEDDDEETLQDHFQLRSRFSRPAYLMSLLSRISRLAWRLVWPRRLEAAQCVPQARVEEIEGH